MTRDTVSRKLFSTLFVLGLANIVLAYALFYFSSVTLLKDRSSEHMSSVRALASQKLTLYLDNLKSVLQDSVDIDAKSFSEKYFLKERFPLSKNNQEMFRKLEPYQFYPYQETELIIRTHADKEDFIWIFNSSTLDKALSEKEGLGVSGENYLVGKDSQIKSTSRHITDWREITVKNKSIELAKNNKTGVHVVEDYRGVQVVSAYSPFKYDKLNYVLLSEIDKDEVLLPLKNLFPKIFLICGIVSILTLILVYLSFAKILQLIDEMKEKINSFHIRFINLTEIEKKKMSYELHDGVGQILTALKWGISRNEDQMKLKELCDDAFKEIRTISNNLMPAALSEFGFFSAVKEYFVKLENFYKIDATYRYSDQLLNYTFREGMDVNLYRMIQELLHNTLKHANAKSVSLVLLKEDENLHLRYEDDGIGMSDAAPMPKVLLYRSELMGATIIRNSGSPGLVYHVEIPLKRLFNDKV